MADLGWSAHMAAGEDAEWGKCFEAAEKHGITPHEAEDCDDGDKGCPECPWKEKEEDNSDGRDALIERVKNSFEVDETP